MTLCYEILLWIRSVWDRELSVTSLSEAVVVVVEGIEVMRDLMTIESIFPKRHLRSLSAICQKKTPPQYQFFRVNIPNRLKFVAIIEGKLGRSVCVAPWPMMGFLPISRLGQSWARLCEV